jgi:hypothetical protein
VRGFPNSCFGGYFGDTNDPRWSTDYAGHIRWCLSANPSNVEHQARLRDIVSGACAACQNYVTFAVQHARENDQLKCGRGGPRWSTDQGGHMRWCQGQHLNPDDAAQHRQAVVDEQNARASEIETCKLTPKVGSGLSTSTAVVPPPKPRATTRLDGVPRRTSSSAVDAPKPQRTVRAKSSSKSSAVHTAKRFGAARVSPCKPGQANDPRLE